MFIYYIKLIHLKVRIRTLVAENYAIA